MKRTIIDLTDLEAWGGHHGGTQRVVYGIAKEYADRASSFDQEIIFAAFSNIDGKFHVTSLEPITQRVLAAQQASATHTETPGGSASKKLALKRQIKRYVPERIWKDERVRSVSRKTLHEALRTRAAITNKLRSTKPFTVSSETTGLMLDITNQDTILILGKPWDNPRIQQYLGDLKLRVNFKLVQVVYDMIICLNPHMHHPSLFTGYTQHMFEAISTSDLLLPISQSSANDVVEFSKRLNLPVPPMQIIRLGDAIAIDGLTGSAPAGINDDFILCVGTIEIRKNHTLLYYMYRLAHEQGIALPQLVIVGSRGWLTGDLQYLIENDPATKGKIKIIDNVDDRSLDWLYQNCLYTVYPTMYEGWGLPVAESLAHGKVCLASASSSVPEIAGDLIDYCSPYNPAEWLEQMATYTKDTLKKREATIRQRYVTTTWADTYEQVKIAIS